MLAAVVEVQETQALRQEQQHTAAVQVMQVMQAMLQQIPVAEAVAVDILTVVLHTQEATAVLE
jgi:hypothetical protein